LRLCSGRPGARGQQRSIICAEAIGYNEKKYNHQPEALDYGNVPAVLIVHPK